MKNLCLLLLLTSLTLDILRAQIYADEVQVVNGLNSNVGIGAQPEGTKLQVNADENHIVRFFGKSGERRITMFDNNSSPMSIYSYNVSSSLYELLAFGHATDESKQMMIDGNVRNVGIGTISSDARLHIATDSPDGPIEVLKIYGSGNNSFSQYIRLGRSDTRSAYIRSITSASGSGTHLSFGTNANNDEATERMRITKDGDVGIGLNNPTEMLSVNGNASKSSAGDWVANSDARLKKNIADLRATESLSQLLKLKGIAYEWDDDKTGINRPIGIQYGFTAQNIQEVFPELVEEDNLGYLQTAYGTYDAMMIEALRALNEKIERLERENEKLKQANHYLRKSDKDQQVSIALLQQQMQELTTLLARTQSKENTLTKTSQR
jgi:hypothetical protein